MPQVAPYSRNWKLTSEQGNMLGIKSSDCNERNHNITRRMWCDSATISSQYNSQRRCLRVVSGATVPGPALEGAPRYRPKGVLLSLSSYILR